MTKTTSLIFYDQDRGLSQSDHRSTPKRIPRDAKEATDWLWRQWHNVGLIRESGVPVIGFTWYSLHDQVDWNIGLRKSLGNVNPVGLYDLNRDPRPVAEAYMSLVEMYQDECFSDDIKLPDGTSLEV